MEPAGDVSQRTDMLCEQWSKVDFHALFGPDIKIFQLGNLSAIISNNRCPFFRLIIHGVSSSELFKSSSIDGVTDLENINNWVKTCLWAHCDVSREAFKSDPRGAYCTAVRFRPALGTDWVPENERQAWFKRTRLPFVNWITY